MEYNIGLDIGTNSVGWAVTDSKNNVLKYGKKALIGSRIFDAGESKEKRRKLRGTRRRLDRRHARIVLLQELLKTEIEKVDPLFFIKLKESFLQKDDENKTNKEGLDIVLKNLDYYKDYKTIYHLRKALIEKQEKFDIRLVYMAISHILKYRGNFLYEGTEFDLNATPDEIKQKVANLIEYLNEKNEDICQNEIEDLIDFLKEEEKSSKKLDNLKNLFNITKENKVIVDNLCKAFVGHSFNASKIFDIDEKLEMNFSKAFEDYQEKSNELLDEKEYGIIENMKEIYDFAVLQKVMKEKQYISDVYIQKYNNYAEDLKLLKQTYKKLLSQEKYDEMFNSKKEIANYYNYNGKNFKNKESKRNGAKKELRDVEFLYRTIGKDLEKYKNEERVKLILDKISEKTFLSRLNIAENGAIPYQIHCVELEKILENQSKFFDILKENKDKIISIMNFRVPYYVGPLSIKSKFAWIERSNEKIKPWNFNDVVDLEKSAENFITCKRLKCTYLIKEDVMPRQSLLYSKFCVLNEITNITVNGKKLDANMRKLIIDDLFLKNKKINEKKLKEFLKENHFPVEIETVGGFTQISGEKAFLNNRGSYIDMIRIFGNQDFVNKNEEKIEELIKAITLFTERKILEKRIKKIFPQIDQEKVRLILKLKYTGWGKLSKKLLTGLKSIDDYKTIIEKLEYSDSRYEDGNIKMLNFMQIINEKAFGFKEQIEALQKERLKDTFSYEDVAEIPCSPAVKRSLWQTIQIVKEIVKIQKCQPKNIFIEFTRGKDKKKKGKNTDSRIERLKGIYETLKEEGKEVFAELKKEKNSLSDMVYLYYLQNGKCLYSGDNLNLSNLSLTCEIDHIIPQCYIKDDSFANKALIMKKYNQRKAGDKTVLDIVPEKEKSCVEALWINLRKCGLIEEKKYKNLTRKTNFKEEEQEKFIARQLVETSQIIKYVANIFDNIYVDTKIFTIHASLSSNFRGKYKITKCRSVNDFHHAHDAFIASVLGNHAVKYELDSFEYGLKNADKMERKVNEYFKKSRKIAKEKAEKKEESYGAILNVLETDDDFNIKQIKEIISNEKILVTKKLEEQTGKFYNQTLYGKTGYKQSSFVNLKKGLDAAKYGGYRSSNKAYYSIILYKNKKNKKELVLVGITIQEAKLIENRQLNLLKCIENKGYKDVKILKEKILKYQKFTDGQGNLLELTSDKEYSSVKQLIFKPKIVESISEIEKKKYLKYNEEQQIEFNEELDRLYIELIKKIKTEVKEYLEESKKLESAEEIFKKLTLEDKVQMLERILLIIKGTYKDLSKLKLSTEVGRRKNFRIQETLVFIEQSITGVFEKRYKIKDLIDLIDFI